MYEDINREYVELSKIPEHTKWAILAAEDITFYDHKGFDLKSIAAALYTKIVEGGEIRGASTITQQLVRNRILTKVIGEEAYKRDTMRKIKEILISRKMENSLDKDTILELYLNDVPLGGTNYGVQTAAKSYFNKDVTELTLSESAFLAGVIHSPTKYYLLLNKKDKSDGIERRNLVLEAMLRNKDKTRVTEEQIAKAKAEPLNFKQGVVKITAPHFVFYVIDELKAKYGEEILYTRGYQITTTLDLDVQKIAEQEIRNGVNKYKYAYGAYNAAAVVLNPKNGDILAMVGSANYYAKKDKRVDGKVNVTTMPRQMGSAVKSITYLIALKQGWNPGSITPDKPLKIGTYRPMNWDKRYMGNLTMRTALNQSRNVSAVYTLQKIGGAAAFVREAKNLGITTLNQPERYGASITLGAAEMKLLELTNVYAIFANGGVKHTPHGIKEIKTAKGELVFSYNYKADAKRVISKGVAYQLNWILCQMPPHKQDKLMAHMYNSNGQNLCGKTGTTSGPKDLTSFLYYPRLAVGVWNGNNNGKTTFGYAGQGWSTTTSLPIARAIMSRLIPKFGKEWYNKPSEVYFSGLFPKVR